MPARRWISRKTCCSADVGMDSIAAGGDQQVDLVGRQLQPRRDGVQPGALGRREILEGDVLDHEADVAAVPAGKTCRAIFSPFPGRGCSATKSVHSARLRRRALSASNSSRTEERIPALETAPTSLVSFGPLRVFTQSPSVSTLESTTMKTKLCSLHRLGGGKRAVGLFPRRRAPSRMPVTPILSVRPPSSSLM